jgi:hypothetical protein
LKEVEEAGQDLPEDRRKGWQGRLLEDKRRTRLDRTNPRTGGRGGKADY